MGLVKSIARNFLFPLITFLGLEKILGAFSKNNFLILMYHGVVKNKNTHLSANHCSRKEFESEIKYLNENFDIVPLDVLFDLSNQNIKPRRKTIAITFDDGYENNFTNAFPILKKYRVPATIFVVGSCVSNPDYILWYDYLDIIKDKILFSEFFKLSLDLPNEKLKQFRTSSYL